MKDGCMKETLVTMEQLSYLKVDEFGQVWLLNEGLVYEGEDGTTHFPNTA